jgi:diacylglycerol kinase family enzyme
MDLDVVIREILDPEVDGKYVRRFRVDEMEAWSDYEMPINLDGEPYKAQKIHFKVVKEAIRLVLPKHCPVIATP